MTEQYFIAGRKPGEPEAIFWLRDRAGEWQVTYEGGHYTIAGPHRPSPIVHWDLWGVEDDTAATVLAAARHVALDLSVVELTDEEADIYETGRRKAPPSYLSIVQAANTLLYRLRLLPGKETFTIAGPYAISSTYVQHLKRYLRANPELRWINPGNSWYVHRDDVRDLCFAGIKGRMAEIVRRNEE